MTEQPFADLLATPGVVEMCELRSRFGFMAYHGGSLEEMTDVIAMAAKLATGSNVDEGWNGFALLHNAASSVGGIDIGFVPHDGGV